MSRTIFDIETGPLPDAILRQVVPPFDPDAVKVPGNYKKADTIAAYIADAEARYWPDILDRAALDPATGRVVAIGYGHRGAIEIDAMTTDRQDADAERTLLQSFWRLFDHRLGEWVGHNCHAFDLPFLIRRSWILGIEPSANAYTRSGARIYLPDRVVDTMALWGLGDRQARISLDALSRTLGGPPKLDGCTGAEFAGMLLGGDADKRTAALCYLRRDIAMTVHVADKLLGEETETVADIY